MDLAIVIPAYKSKFLAATLTALVQQTNRNFTVYIGDDASPQPVQTVVAAFETTLPIKYTRFSDNLGATSLVSHWHRCIDLSKNESWIWLLCDDDVPTQNCVELFYKTASENACSAIRFASVEVNSFGKAIKNKVVHPFSESGTQFLTRKLLSFTRSSLSEYVFSRSAYLQVGGFVNFPAAWGSDDAFWYAIGNIRPIVSINTAVVNITMSGENISSENSVAVVSEKAKGSAAFYEWLKQQQPDYYEDVVAKMNVKQAIIQAAKKTPFNPVTLLKHLPARRIPLYMQLHFFKLWLAYSRQYRK